MLELLPQRYLRMLYLQQRHQLETYQYRNPLYPMHQFQCQQHQLQWSRRPHCLFPQQIYRVNALMFSIEEMPVVKIQVVHVNKPLHDVAIGTIHGAPDSRNLRVGFVAKTAKIQVVLVTQMPATSFTILETPPVTHNIAVNPHMMMVSVFSELAIYCSLKFCQHVPGAEGTWEIEN